MSTLSRKALTSARHSRRPEKLTKSVIDLFSRQVVGWAMGKRITRHLVIDALTMAWFRRRPAEGLIFHSDQGSQYASSDFQATLRGYAMRGSMSRKGNCWEPVRVSEATTR